MIAVDIVIHTIVDTERMTPEIKAALEALAEVMIVQGEDGLYSAGNPDAGDYQVLVDGKWEDRQNEHIAELPVMTASISAPREVYSFKLEDLEP